MLTLVDTNQFHFNRNSTNKLATINTLLNSTIKQKTKTNFFFDRFLFLPKQSIHQKIAIYELFRRWFHHHHHHHCCCCCCCCCWRQTKIRQLNRQTSPQHSQSIQSMMHQHQFDLQYIVSAKDLFSIEDYLCCSERKEKNKVSKKTAIQNKKPKHKQLTVFLSTVVDFHQRSNNIISFDLQSIQRNSNIDIQRTDRHFVVRHRDRPHSTIFLKEERKKELWFDDCK